MYPEAGSVFPGLFLALCHSREISTIVRAWIAHLQSVDVLFSAPSLSLSPLSLAIPYIIGIQKIDEAMFMKHFETLSKIILCKPKLLSTALLPLLLTCTCCCVFANYIQ